MPSDGFKPLDLTTIESLLDSELSASEKHRQENLHINSAGPLGVLIRLDDCVMCIREQGPHVKGIYTVNGHILCAPHAMYALSKICVENGYKVSTSCKVKIEEKVGQL